jgi:hypothetical protein
MRVVFFLAVFSKIYYNRDMKLLFYFLLIDSIGANVIAWGNERKWYRKNFRIFSRYFPATKGWTTYYLILVILIGVLIYG